MGLFSPTKNETLADFWLHCLKFEALNSGVIVNIINVPMQYLKMVFIPGLWST